MSTIKKRARSCRFVLATRHGQANTLEVIMYQVSKMIGELNEALFKLRRPLAEFLARLLPPVLGDHWEARVLEGLRKNERHSAIIKTNDMSSFFELDIAILLDVFKNYYTLMGIHYNKLEKAEYYQYYGKFKDKYLIETIKIDRNLLAHPNEATVNIEGTRRILDDFIQFGEFIEAGKAVLKSLEIVKEKYTKYQHNKKEEKEKSDRITFIEDKVIKPALNNDALNEDISTSVLLTLFRLKNKKTAPEIDDFFMEAQRSPRGIKVKEALNRVGLLAFEDIVEEYEKRFVSQDNA
jgi:hypothetical protein